MTYEKKQIITWYYAGFNVKQEVLIWWKTKELYKKINTYVTTDVDIADFYSYL